jgi:HK97 gp10 family phage protein
MTSIKVIGIPQTLFALQSFTPELRRKHLKIAMSAAGGVMKDAAKPRMPKETGLLRQAISVKAHVPKKENRPAYALIGTSNKVVGAVAQIGGRTRTLTNARFKKLNATNMGAIYFGRMRRPSRYLHLVEKGTRRSSGAHVLETTYRVMKSAAEAAAVVKLKQGVAEVAFGLSKKAFK